MARRIRVWDVPTRLFHWMQLIAFAGAYLTAESERNRDIHVAMGYIVLGLLVFRVIWGFAGTRYARFSSFIFKPREIINYLSSLIKGQAKHYTGHNPAGSVVVWLLLVLVLFIGITGVLALQDDASDTVIMMHGVATKIIMYVIAIHLIGVAVSSILHRENLVRSMISGYKLSSDKEENVPSYSWLGVLLVVATVIFWFVYI